jgi:ubiquinone/menaquinone biosynthesis C-methylase UbiE
MDFNPPNGIQVNSTDVNAMPLAQLQAKLAENPERPVKIETMDACILTFPDNNFDLSVASFVFSGPVDDIAAALHMLRTLKPGGTGAITVWRDMPWHVALEHAHQKTCGADEPMAPYLSINWYKSPRSSRRLAMRVRRTSGSWRRRRG